MTERRKDIRFKSKLLLSIIYRDDTDKIVAEESIASEDISAGGLRIAFPRQLPRGKVVDLKLFLFSDPIQLPAQGKVVWSDKKQKLELALRNNKQGDDKGFFWVGIQFIDVDLFTQQRILRWLKREFAVK